MLTYSRMCCSTLTEVIHGSAAHSTSPEGHCTLHPVQTLKAASTDTMGWRLHILNEASQSGPERMSARGDLHPDELDKIHLLKVSYMPNLMTLAC